MRVTLSVVLLSCAAQAIQAHGPIPGEWGEAAGGGGWKNSGRTSGLVASASTPQRNPEQLAPGAAARIVDALAEGMRGYIDAVDGARICEALRRERSRLIQIADREALVDALNAILASNARDLHLKVRIDTGSAAITSMSSADEATLQRHLAHGLMAIRRLPGNIGYLKLRYFAADAEGALLIDRAMAMLADCDGLILDLRENTGGGGASDARLIGHLSTDPLPMARIEWREADGSSRIEEGHPSVAATGPAWPTKPIFVLIANRTFSAAEALAYDLQSAGRATLFVERTRGGANPANQPVHLGSGLSAFIPNGRVVHPTTGGNWEGVGVTPDVPTPPREALVAAYRLALESAEPKITTAKSSDERKRALADPLATLQMDGGL